MLELKNVEVNKRIGQQLLGSLLILGREKFSSNVIEKCLEHNCMDVKEAMVKEILSADSFYEFLLDQYGNYVIQKSLSVAVEPHFSEFIEKLKPDMERLRTSTDFGVKIYNRLVKQYPQLAMEPFKGASKNFSAKKTGAASAGGKGTPLGAKGRGSRGGKRKGDKPEPFDGH